jgi:SPP1 family predicted phage head-tail adaptor
MQAGRLRHRVIIQNYTTTRATDGQELKTWAAVATVWAEVMNNGGAERYAQGADQRVATATHKIRMRQRSDLTLSPQAHRINWGGKLFDIEAVTDADGRTREIHAFCREVVSEAPNG